VVAVLVAVAIAAVIDSRVDRADDDGSTGDIALPV